jgi:nucleotide-binding universal stress UspA family protein
MHDPDATRRPPAPGAAAASAPRSILSGTDGRVVFAIDFGPASLGAARWAVSHLARRASPNASPAGSPATCVAHVVPWPHDVRPGEVSRDDAAAVQPLEPALVGGLAGVAASLGLGESRTVVRIGRPSTELDALADSEHARLLVLGRRRNSARNRVGEPNVTERVTRRAGCDVLVVPEGAPGPVQHVVAAVDASAWAAIVTARAIELARDLDAALTLVHVLAPASGSYDRVSRKRRREAEATDVGSPRDLAAHQDAAYGWLASLARDADPRTTCRLAAPVGDAARAIGEVASEYGPSLVVVGKRGADEAPRGSLGSVARDLVKRGVAPVLALDAPGGHA